jgi:hypothetical protein
VQRHGTQPLDVALTLRCTSTTEANYPVCVEPPGIDLNPAPASSPITVERDNCVRPAVRASRAHLPRHPKGPPKAHNADYRREQAADCAVQAKAAIVPESKDAFLDVEQRWLLAAADIEEAC